MKKETNDKIEFKKGPLVIRADDPIAGIFKEGVQLVDNISFSKDEFDEMFKSVEKSSDEQIDELEAVILQEGKLVDCPLDHVFTNGLYTRTALMVEGALATSMVHKEQHQYFMLQGVARVKVVGGKWERMVAPQKGITEAGTRRVFIIEKECIWATAHATNIMPASNSKEDLAAAVELVEDQIYVRRENTVLGGFVKGNILTKSIEK